MTEQAESDFSKILKKNRRELDSLDQKLLILLNRRFRISLKIGKIKKRIGMRIYDAEREREILDTLKRKNKGPLKEKDLKEIFATILQVSRKSQT